MSDNTVSSFTQRAISRAVAQALAVVALAAHGSNAIFHLCTSAGEEQKRKRRLLLLASAVPVFGAVAAFAVAPIAPDAALLPTRFVTELLPQPALATPAILDGGVAGGVASVAPALAGYIHEERIRRGDTLALVLNRLGVSDPAAEQFIRTDPAARALYQLRPGKIIQARTGDTGDLLWLNYVHTPADSDSKLEGMTASPTIARALQVERTGKGFRAHDAVLENERRVEMRTGTVASSLFGATDAAHVPDAVAVQIGEILSGDIDFYRDLRRGDNFRVIYEMFYQGGEAVRSGRVLAVEFVNNGKAHAAVWYQAAGQDGSYYGFDGHSLRRAFLKAPLEFTRISSGFGGRMHPILNTWKQHTGVDYAAPIGTPIRATGDGTVEFVGRQNGYGNAVALRHDATYSTLYGHMSAFASGLRKGEHISQGQIIGYVGMTGWATGPHLHYEFRINGAAHNPLTVAMPQAQPIPTTQMAAFRQHSAELNREIGLLRAMDNIQGS